MKFPFSIKPIHWWSYLNPFWWRRKKVIERVLAYTWDKEGLEEKMEKAIRDSLIFGEGKMPIDWSEKP